MKPSRLSGYGSSCAAGRAPSCRAGRPAASGRRGRRPPCAARPAARHAPPPVGVVDPGLDALHRELLRSAQATASRRARSTIPTCAVLRARRPRSGRRRPAVLERPRPARPARPARRRANAWPPSAVGLARRARGPRQPARQGPRRSSGPRVFSGMPWPYRAASLPLAVGAGWHGPVPWNSSSSSSSAWSSGAGRRRAVVARPRRGAHWPRLAPRPTCCASAWSTSRRPSPTTRRPPRRWLPLRDALVRVEQQVGHPGARPHQPVRRAGDDRSRQVHESTAALGRQTQSLAGSLNSSTVRGAWGEVQLRRVLEHAGLLARCDFDEQVSPREPAPAPGAPRRRGPAARRQVPRRRLQGADGRLPRGPGRGPARPSERTPCCATTRRR